MAGVQLRSARKTMPAGHAGAIIGRVVAENECGELLVDFPGKPAGEAVAARAVFTLKGDEVGCEAVLLLEGGNPRRPIAMGILRPPAKKKGRRRAPIQVRADGQDIRLAAERELTLSCGDASITLTRAGKILLRGKYVLSRSSGVNAIKGGSVQIN